MLLVLHTFQSFAQDTLPESGEETDWICHYLGDAHEFNGPEPKSGTPAQARSTASTQQIRNSPASPEAIAVINNIMDVVGLKPRFEVRSSTVPNAAAVIYGNKRYVLYNPKFISLIQKATHTDWSAISILAHELGHHLNGHTLERGGSKPANELEADEFSGFVLRKMGASLKQAQAAMAVIPNKTGTHTHPAQKDRLTAIARGWQKADTRIAQDARGIQNKSLAVWGNAETSAEEQVAAIAHSYSELFPMNGTADAETDNSQPEAEETLAWVDFHAAVEDACENHVE